VHGDMEICMGDASAPVGDLMEVIKPKLASSGGPPDLALLREQMKAQVKATGMEVPEEALAKVDDETLLQNFSDRVEILALTVPTPGNGHISVSMYYNKDNCVAANPRATAIARACGHASAEIVGPAFVSRIIDDERKDIWKRVDIGIDEMVPSAEWIVAASKPGGGGGRGSAASSSGLLASQLAQMKGLQSRPEVSEKNRRGKGLRLEPRV